MTHNIVHTYKAGHIFFLYTNHINLQPSSVFAIIAKGEISLNLIMIIAGPVNCEGCFSAKLCPLSPHKQNISINLHHCSMHPERQGSPKTG